MDDMLLTEQEAPHALTSPYSTADADAREVRLSRDEAERLVLTTVAAHADQLLRTARRYSMCTADAEDAYQRALEIFMRRAPTLDEERAPRWLTVVVRHEALAVRKGRHDLAASPHFDIGALEAPLVSTPEERLLAGEDTTRAAEALQRLKPQELRAMWLKAMGNSYEEISETTGWSYTKVNRCLSEGRRTFLERYAGIQAGRECERWAPVLSAILDGEATAAQLADARPHLRNCHACRATLKEMRQVAPRLTAILPPVALVPAVMEPGTTHGFAGRVWDSVVLGAYERMTTATMKVHTPVEAATTTKAAAVVASAAAVAGGGAAVVDRTSDHARDRHKPVAAKRSAQAAAPRTAAIPSATAAAPAKAATSAGRPSAASTANRSSAPATADSRKPPESVAVAREFVEQGTAPAAAASTRSGPPRAAAPRAPAKAVAPPPTAASGNGGEFDP